MKEEKEYYVVYSRENKNPIVIAYEKGYAKSLLAGICLGGHYDRVSKEGLLKIIKEEF